MSINEVFCPECEHRLKLGARPYKGQRIICSACRTTVTIVNLRPLEFETTLSIQRTGRKKSNTIELACPECEAFVRISSRAHEGQQIVCHECDTLLEVVSTDPLELDTALMIDIKHDRRQRGRR